MNSIDSDSLHFSDHHHCSSCYAMLCHEIRANFLHLAVLRHSQRTQRCESLTHKPQNMGTLFKKVFDNSDSDIQLLNLTLTAQNHKTRHGISLGQVLNVYSLQSWNHSMNCNGTDWLLFTDLTRLIKLWHDTISINWLVKLILAWLMTHSLIACVTWDMRVVSHESHDSWVIHASWVMRVFFYLLLTAAHGFNSLVDSDISDAATSPRSTVDIWTCKAVAPRRHDQNAGDDGDGIVCDICRVPLLTLDLTRHDKRDLRHTVGLYSAYSYELMHELWLIKSYFTYFLW